MSGKVLIYAKMQISAVSSTFLLGFSVLTQSTLNSSRGKFSLGALNLFIDMGTINIAYRYF